MSLESYVSGLLSLQAVVPVQRSEEGRRCLFPFIFSSQVFRQVAPCIGPQIPKHFSQTGVFPHGIAQEHIRSSTKR